jgi:hypothetical protein
MAIRIKKIEEIGKIKVYLVDGEQVRDTLDTDFTNFGQHYRFDFIPKDEFWIDHEEDEDEVDFYIEHLLVEFSLMEKGVGYEEALKKADNVEQKSRDISAGGKTQKKKSGSFSDYAKLRIELIQRVKTVSIWLVDGKMVRDELDIDYTEGGHGYVYNYIPKTEIWIDNDVVPEERPYILLHEMYERNLMRRGMVYDEAHKRATRIEHEARQKPNLLRKYLEDEANKIG